MVKIEEITNKVNEKYGVVEVFIKDEYQRVFKGKAKCASDDKYDFDFGEKLAYLRAKRKMVRFYKKANENQLIVTRKSMADFETRMAKELGKHENVLNKVDEAIEKMLSE